MLVLGKAAGALARDALAEAGTTRRAYLLKERLCDPPTLERAIRDVASGGAVVDPRIVESSSAGAESMTRPAGGSPI